LHFATSELQFASGALSCGKKNNDFFAIVTACALLNIRNGKTLHRANAPSKEVPMGRNIFLMGATVVLLGSAGGCATSKPNPAVAPANSNASETPAPAPAKTPQDAVPQPAPGQAVLATKSVALDAPSIEVGRIHFDFDSTTIRTDARPILENVAAQLKVRPGVALTVEGHCDDRGTTEYNLALGERRAQAVVKYLAQMGVSAERLTTISFGEARPLATGDDEEAWAQNRRGELIPKGQSPASGPQ
jgi:peptidoglycan-associated lipoprotein